MYLLFFMIFYFLNFLKYMIRELFNLLKTYVISFQLQDKTQSKFLQRILILIVFIFLIMKIKYFFYC